MKGIEALVTVQNSSTAAEEIPCVACGHVDHAMVHILLRPVKEGTYLKVTPLGGVYCTLCTMKFSIELSTECLKAARLNQ